MLCRIGACILAFNNDLFRTIKLGFTVDDGNLVLLEKMTNTAGQLFGNATRPLNDGIKIKGRLFARKAIFLCMVHVAIYFG